MGVALVGLDVRIQHVNRRFCEMLGYSEEEIVALGIQGITHSDDCEADHQLRMRLVRGEIPSYKIEKRYVRKDGRVVWGQLTNSMMHDAEGKPARIIAMVEDVTERKRAQEALADRERHYRTIIDTVPLLVYECGIDGVLTFANAVAEPFVGYKAEELVGTTVWDRMGDDDQQKEMAAWLRRIAVEQPPPTPYFGVRRRKDGRWIDIRADWNYLRNERGEVTGFVCVVSDITEQKRAEEALKQAHDELERRVEERTAELREANQRLHREVEERRRVEEALRANETALRQSERRFRNYFEQGLIGMAVTSLDTRWLEVNDRLCEILGRSREELLQSRWAELTHPDDLGPSLSEFNRLLAGEIDHYTLDKRFIRRDGSLVYTTVHVRAFRKNDWSIDHIVSLTEDITARKEAEEALRQSHDQLQTVYDGMVEGLIITDIETKRIKGVNCSFCRMLGYNEEELLTKSIPDLHPPAEVANDLQRFQAVAEGRISINEGRPVLRKDDSLFYADITGHRILYEGRPCLLALFRDVTERRQAQAALERERRTLKHMLRASDHERQLIAYDIHDGLAQHLAGAVMQFQTYDHLKDTKPKEAARAFEAGVTLLRQGHFEARRLISGVRPPILDESGVVAALAHLVNERSFEGGPKIELHSKVTFTRLAPILENAIYRIVQEGLTNACKHSKSEEVQIRLLQRGDRVRIEIRDSGIGFDPRVTQDNRYGLPGIRERARVLGGKCKILSKCGEGTAVVVELPLLAKELDE